MSIPSELNRINSAVSEQADLLAQIQTALEGKVSGGGGASVDTCTVTISSMPAVVGCTCYENGEFTYQCLIELSSNPVSGDLTNVVCGSLVSISIAAAYSIVASGAELVAEKTWEYIKLFQITASAGETVTFQAIYND